jgi:hypothetical protein
VLPYERNLTPRELPERGRGHAREAKVANHIELGL